MDEILHIPREESSAIRPPLAQLRDGWKAGTVALMQRVESLRCRLDVVTTGSRRLINPLHLPVAAVVIGMAAVVGTVYTPNYVVEVDGAALGTVTSLSVFEDIVDRVESRITNILGYGYTMDNAVTYTPALTERESITLVADFETYLFGQTGEIIRSYVLAVNGQFIGMAQDRETLSGMLEQVKTVYVDEGTVSVGFTFRIYITHEYTPSGVNQGPAVMPATLIANTNGQTTYEVQEGDTFMRIASDNDMSMSELEALNLDVDINCIYIGQLLNMKEEIPFLSVKTVDSATYTESIECPVVEMQNDSMYQGESRVSDADAPGEQIVNADIAYLSGVRRERAVLSTQATWEATNEIITVGAKARPFWLPNGYFIQSVYGRITSCFSYRSIFGSYSYHGGTDVTTPYGTSIAAADDGTVVFVGRATGSIWSYGDLAIVDHGNRKQIYHGYCSSVLASAGDKAYQGRPVAKVDFTGRSTGNHCHFKVRINGTSVSPLSYLS